jgi:hypothetical protein
VNVFLIGYGVVAGFNVGDEKPPEVSHQDMKKLFAIPDSFLILVVGVFP